MVYRLSAVDITHRVIAERVKPGAICLDATAGRGYDTAFLCHLVGKTGKVWAFDIQEEALKSTHDLLQNRGLDSIAEVVLDNHINMDKYVEAETVSCVMFNFGWLPGSDHRITTSPETSVLAIQKALALLGAGGILSLCIYYGKDTGFAEKEAILAYCESLNHRQYTVLKTEFLNCLNCPPVVIFVFKNS